MQHTVLVTGANRGVGLALAEQYHKAGWRVIGACRESSDDLQAVADKVIDRIDVTQADSVAALAHGLEGETLDLLINHPGYVKTRMVNFGGVISPEEAAAGIVARIDALTLDNTGGFWHSNGEELPW